MTGSSGVPDASGTADTVYAVRGQPRERLEAPLQLERPPVDLVRRQRVVAHGDIDVVERPALGGCSAER